MTITYDGGEKEKFRLERLISFLAGLKKTTLHKIKQVHDHKGCLEVYWIDEKIENFEIDDIKENWENQNETNYIIFFK